MKLKGRLNSFTLKIIACLTMLCDHFAIVFLPPESAEYLVLRIIGRIAFPLFAFLIIEGFFHSSNLKKYMLRLFLLAVISEPFFDHVILKPQGITNIWAVQNTVFTLFIGLVTVWLYDTIIRKYQEQPFLSNTYCVITLVAGSMLSLLIGSDYPIYGVMLIFIMYLFHKNKLWMAIASAAVVLFFGGEVQSFQMIGIFIIWFYNGQEGKKIQSVFYLFYPLHLALLAALHLLF